MIPHANESPIVHESIPFRNALFPFRIHEDFRSETHTGTPPKYAFHEQLEILYVTEGSVICECDFNRYVCNAGDIVIINPCEVHNVEFLNAEAHYLCLMIDPRFYSSKGDISGVKYTDPMQERLVRFRHVITDNERAHEILMELLREYREAEPAFELSVKGNLLRFLAELFRSERIEEPMNRSIAEQASIRAALDYIEEHYAEEISLHDLAEACSMSLSYFCRRFHSVTGRAAMSYVNEYRLSKAHELLISTRLRISEISARTGFSDSNYFARAFKKFYGASPRETRATQI